MTNVRLAPEALAELTEAAAWYESQGAGLGTEFLDEIERTLPLIESFPSSFPQIIGLSAAFTIRRALLARFPYAVVFIELPSDIRVLAIAHFKRRPGYWLARVDR